MSEEDKETVKKILEEAETWTKSNPEATKEEYEEKLKEVEE